MHGSADLLDFSVFCFILCTSKVGMHIDIDMLLSYIPFYICFDYFTRLSEASEGGPRSISWHNFY